MAFLFSPFEWVSKIRINGMSKVDQKQAVRNVAYCADATWTCALCPYQKANMDLYLATVHINSRTLKWSPRTVRDSIPKSKLAHYANYEYNEARELSYTPMVLKYERLYPTFAEGDVREPWMLEEIDDLLIGFLSFRDEDTTDTLSSSNKDITFESPFLDADTFDEMALKLRISPVLLSLTASKNLKKIWDTQYFPYFGWRPESKTSRLVLFKSPTSQLFTSVKEGCTTNEWFQNSEEDLTQIKALSKTIKQQNTWIFKKQAATWHDTPQPHKRLYSAVLQGDTPPDQPAKSREAEPALLRLPCPYYVATRQPTPLATGVYATPPFPHQYIPLYPPSNYIPTTSLLNFRQTNYFPLMLQNATPPYVNYPSYRTVVFPPRPQMVVPSGGWFLPPPQVKVNLLAAQPVVHFRPPKPTLIDQELETIAVKTVNAVLDEPEPYVPVTGVSSDELELQALEQYNSSTSVFQELEREAAEQYDTSENWTGPPDEIAALFGGCSVTVRLGARIMV